MSYRALDKLASDQSAVACQQSFATVFGMTVSGLDLKQFGFDHIYLALMVCH
jgi:hypothetical protein